MSFGARAEIRLDALRANLKRLASCVPEARVMAAVKADAYGHGLVTVSRALDDADALAVARLVEAEALRSAGIARPIVLMGGVIDAEEIARAAELECDLVAHSPRQLTLLEGSDVPPLKTWIKVDTGMHRLGFDPEDVPAVIDRLASARSARDLGLMTHLANADDRADSRTIRQMERLVALARDFDGDVSIANSAALLGWNEPLQEFLDAAGVRNSWIRPGLSLYGISPLRGHSAEALGLEPVMNFDTCLLSVKPLRAGEPVGYGGTWSSERDTVLGVAAAGYGDGYSRFIPSGTPVLVNGRRVPLAGVISMDLLTVDLGPGADDEVGDPVRLWGVGLAVEEIAAYAGTTAYPLVTGVRKRGL